MVRKSPKEVITLDRQSSSLSTNSSNTSSTALLSSSWSDLSSLKTPDGSQDGFLQTSIVNLIISLAIFGVGFWGNHYLVPAHEHVYTRPHPFQTTQSGGDVILNSEWNHPLVHPASVPSKLLRQTCVYIPLVLLVLIHRFTSRNNSGAASWHCTLSSITGLLTGLGMCELLTHLLKYYVLRRRPNFYALCQWDGEVCTADATKILESQLSFPSGHSSMSWCGMTFLVLVLLGRFQLVAQQPTSLAQCRWRPWALWMVCLIPWSWSSYVATSRIVDNWHHASDVVAGTALGIACATLSYHSVFPNILSTQAGTSYTELVAQKNY